MSEFVRRVADRLVDRAVGMIGLQGRATVVDLAVINVAGTLYRLAEVGR